MRLAVIWEKASWPDGRTDTPSYTDATANLKRKKQNRYQPRLSAKTMESRTTNKTSITYLLLLATSKRIKKMPKGDGRMTWYCVNAHQGCPAKMYTSRPYPCGADAVEKDGPSVPHSCGTTKKVNKRVKKKNIWTHKKHISWQETWEMKNIEIGHSHIIF